MTNFAEVTRSFEHLSALAPEFFMPIHTDADLARATAFLSLFDTEVKGERPHALDPLADALMARITAYEAARFPVADTDGASTLRFLLEQRSATQQQLADATGIKQETISALLNRKRGITADHARRLAAHFGVNPGVFL